MTKFVAALFLPVIARRSTALLPAGRRQRLRRGLLRAGSLSAVLVVALAAPWFVYQ